MRTKTMYKHSEDTKTEEDVIKTKEPTNMEEKDTISEDRMTIR